MTEPNRYDYRAPSGLVLGSVPTDATSPTRSATPVVVLDPSDPADVARLAEVLDVFGYVSSDATVTRILAALLPSEPVTEPGGGAWAVVKDRVGDLWLRGEDGLWWHADADVDWAGLVHDYGPVTVLREGVETDE